MSAWYNENDPFAAAWLRELIAAGAIAPGDVDERSIVDIRPSDIVGYDQYHFFAGIGVWSYALRLAGWPDDRPIWTGSCPCQPFSAAGKGGGHADERHLWPAFHHLIGEHRPDVVVGEQVASKDGLMWLDLVHADLEDEGYAVGAVDTCAAGVGAPHIRQRLWWVGKRLADAEGVRERPDETGRDRSEGIELAGAKPGRYGRHDGADGGLADADDARPQGRRVGGNGAAQRAAGAGGVAGGLADAHGSDRRQGPGQFDGQRSAQSGATAEGHGWPRPVDGFWRDADWLFCRDGKWRPVEPGTFPLAHGAAARVGRLRGYGNAINAEAAKIFIQSVMDVL